MWGVAKVAMTSAVLFPFVGGSGLAGMEKPPPLRLLGLSFSHSTIIHSAIVAVAVYVFVWLLARNLSRERPRRGQAALEFMVQTFLGLVRQTIGPNRGPRFLPYIGTLFIFVWCCNMITLIPVRSMHFGGEFYHDYNNNGLYDPGEPYIDANGDGVHNPGFQLPAFEEPTTDLTFPLTLALIFVVLLGHGSGLVYHGLWGYLKEYFSPGGVIGLCMFPLNVVGKFAELVSISFRIFGNIFGGAIIMSVVAGLLYYFLVPIGMYAYFNVFCGTIQAFVFTMLAATYISMEAGEPVGEGGAAE